MKGDNRIVVGVTGASGTVLAVRLLESLKNFERHLVISDGAKRVMSAETDLAAEDFTKIAEHVYDDSDLAAPVSSGSFRFRSFVIIPCSNTTLARMAAGMADTLITRIAAVSMKERRRMVIVPREMPLSSIYIENMLKLSMNGVIVAPAMPGYYTKPKTADDMVNFVVSRVLDLMGIDNEMSGRWKDY
ncbi:MAG: UbiX family flavin prenyltransferase [Candidatus Thermoplasmatota archaeon]|nr:UbiX family flavin prenyltransferase [Candidatus Thermoplasmatota archaeon]